MERFQTVEERLIAEGHQVLNPASVNSMMPDKTSYEEYMQVCFCLLDMADAIYMMHGWGFYSNDNLYGWKLNFKHYPVSELDKWEQYWILEYTKRGYQCRYNKTAGGQGEGKEKINEFRPAKGYRDGLKQGRKNMAKGTFAYH